MFRTSTTIATMSLCVVLAACGGGGGDENTSSPANSSTNGSSSGSGNTVSPSGNSAGADSNTGSTDSVSNTASTPSTLSATVTQAPEDGSRFLSGTVRIDVSGTGMRNVELLPESGYVPTLSSFNISGDGTYAYLDLDTKLIPNGGIKLRISAFDQPAGTANPREVIAMPTRTWLVNNPEQPAGSPAGRAISCLGLGYPYTSMADPQPVVCVRFTAPSPPIPREQCTSGFSTLYANPGDLRTVFRDGTLASGLSCVPEANNGNLHPDCVCMG